MHTPCEDDFITGSLCDKHENEILHVTHIPTASDCQSICQNHPECNFFSHTTRHEGKHGKMSTRCYNNIGLNAKAKVVTPSPTPII